MFKRNVKIVSKSCLKLSKNCQIIAKKFSKSCQYICSIFEKSWKMEVAEEIKKSEI
jgi:hypothetical protein